MHILYLCQDHGIPVLGRRGCSTHVRETCNALMSSGHEVTILCSLRGEDKELQNNLRIIESNPGRMRKIGYDGRNIYHNLAFTRVARKLIESEKFDAIYERFSLYGLAGTRLGRQYRLPRIVEVNAFLSVEHRHKIRLLPIARQIERSIVRQAPAVVVVSVPLRDTLIDMGVERGRISIMPMAVDVDHFKPDPAMGRAMREKWDLGDNLVIGYIGTLSGWHGIAMLHDMTERIRAVRDDFRIFAVGGEARQLENHRRMAAERGLDSHLRFIGSVPYSDVPACINAMDIALVPDTNYWTCPTKMFEYQACAIPTVAPRYDAILRAMDHEREGMLFDPQDLTTAVEHILTLARDPERRRAIGANARIRVVSTHSWQHNVERIIDLFERMRSGEMPFEGPYQGVGDEA